VNVSEEEKAPDSLLHWYRTLIELKKTSPVLAEGDEVMLDETNANVLSWLRKAQDGSQIVVSCNFTADPQTVNLTAGGGGLNGSHAKTLLKSPGSADPASLDAVALQPFGVYIGQVQ
jgi:alpha-glucosidase